MKSKRLFIYQSVFSNLPYFPPELSILLGRSPFSLTLWADHNHKWTLGIPLVACGEPTNIFRGSRSYGMRITRPAHCNCTVVTKLSIGFTFNLFSSSSVVIRCRWVCHLFTLHIALAHRAWNTRSFRYSLSVRHQLSEPYNSIRRISPSYTNFLASKQMLAFENTDFLSDPKAPPALSILAWTSSSSLQSLVRMLPR